MKWLIIGKAECFPEKNFKCKDGKNNFPSNVLSIQQGRYNKRQTYIRKTKQMPINIYIACIYRRHPEKNS